jgi:tRNA(adenine34) deaminase
MSTPFEPDPVADELWMREALSEAARALDHRDVPVGALVLDAQGIVLGRGHNERELSGDPTAHAEILALRRAAQQRGHWRLDDCTLFVTLEPCAMCAGAMVNARLGRLVYGARDPKAGAIESVLRLAAEPRLNHHFPAQGGVLAGEGAALLGAFFKALRAEGQK